MTLVIGDSASRSSDIPQSNYYPPPENVEEINTLLLEHESRFESLNCEIEHLKTRLKESLQQQDELSNLISSQRAHLAPIRRLPPEILAIIFLHCLPTEHNPIRSVDEAPLLLARVCKTWHQVCLATPRLWSAMHIHIPLLFIEGFCDKIAGRKEGVHRWFSRSGDTPLSLSLFSCRDLSESASPEVNQEISTHRDFVDSLMQFNPRWTRLELLVTNPILETFGKVRSTDFATLRTLKLRDLSWDELRDDQQPSDGHPLANLFRAPNLRELSLHGYSVHPLKLSIPWHRLTVVDMQTHIIEPCLTPQELLDMLSQTTVLKSCSLEVKIPDSYESIVERSVLELPYLEVFKLSFVFETQGGDSPGCVIESLFDYMSAPALKTLSLDMEINRLSIMPHVPFLSLLNPMHTDDPKPSPIEDLHIALPISTGALLESLRLMPSIKHLMLSECSVFPHSGSVPRFFLTDAVLQEMTPVDERPAPLVPNLESLIIRKCEAISERALVEFIKARTPKKLNGVSNIGVDETESSGNKKFVNQLRSISVRYHREMKDDILDEVVALQSEDLRICVTFYPKPSDPDSPWIGLESVVHRWRQSDERTGVWESYESGLIFL